MDVVLGVSVAPATVRLVVLEGQNATGLTVDQDDFTVPAGADDAQVVTERVVSAILGTRESARQGGLRLVATGVTVSDQTQAALVRDALAAHQVENVMLVSAFLAGAALAQAVGGAIGYARIALLFVEPDAATVAVVDASDGSVIEVHRRLLSGDDDGALAELKALVADVHRLESSPDGVFAVGSGVNVAMIKPDLQAATPLAVSAPEEPETALARGAALASAQAPLFASSTRAVAWARDPDTGGYHVTPGDEDDALTTALNLAEQRRIPFLLAGSAMATLLVVGVVALLLSMAVDIRSSADPRPNAGGNVVVAPTQRAPVTPTAQPPPPPAPPPPSAPPPSVKPTPKPAPKVVVPKPAVQKPVHRAPAYTPPPAAPAPPPAAPAPAPAPAALPPPPPPPPPALPTMPPMTMWLRLPFVSIPIPINPPPPPPPPAP